MKKLLSLIKKRWYIILIIVVLGGYFYKTKNASAIQKNEKTYTLKKQDLKETLSLSGEIDADEKAILRFQSSSRLSWVGVKEGDYVKKYQSIASLDQRDVQKKLSRYLNTYMKTRWDFEQTKDDNKNFETDLMTDEQRTAIRRIVEKSQFDLNNSVIDVELQDLSLQYANLFTPIEGLVVRVDSPYAGVNITPSQAEFEIVNPKSIYFSVTADQTEVIKLKELMEGAIDFDSYPESPTKGEISYIAYSPKTGETGTVYKIKMRLVGDNSSYKYKLGMTGDVNFLVKEKNNVLSLPSSYVLSDKEGKYVEKKVKNKKIKTYIKLGEEIDDSSEVLSGLNEGDVIYIGSLK